MFRTSDGFVVLAAFGGFALLYLGLICRGVLPWVAPYVLFALVLIVHPIFVIPGLFAIGWATCKTIKIRNRTKQADVPVLRLP